MRIVSAFLWLYYLDIVNVICLAWYNITLMMVMTNSLLPILVYVQSLPALMYVTIYMLYSVLCTYGPPYGYGSYWYMHNILLVITILMGMQLCICRMTIICYIILLITKIQICCLYHWCCNYGFMTPAFDFVACLIGSNTVIYVNDNHILCNHMMHLGWLCLAIL